MLYGPDEEYEDYAWMHNDSFWEEADAAYAAYDSYYGTNYGGAYSSKAASSGLGSNWNRYAQGSTNSYVSYGAYSGNYTTATKKEEPKLPPELVKKVAAATGHIYANKEEALENKEGKVNAYFPGTNGWYGVLTRTINGNTIKLIDKLPKCPLVDDVETGIVDYTVVNKIPAWIFKELIGNYAHVNNLQGTEAAAQIYRKNDTGEYWIYYPKQVVSAAHVAYDKDPNVKTLRQTNTLVMETHSHDSMGAFWSGEDNRNETEAGAYMVIGTLGSATATYKARVKVGTVYKDMPAYVFFDMTPEEEAEYVKKENWEAKNPENLVSQLEKPVYTYGAYGQGTYSAANRARTYNTSKQQGSNTTQQGVGANGIQTIVAKHEHKTQAEVQADNELMLENASIWKTFLRLFSNLWSRDALNSPAYNRSKEVVQYLTNPVVDEATKNKLSRVNLVTPGDQIREEFEKAEIITDHDLAMGSKAALAAYGNLGSTESEGEIPFNEDILESFDTKILSKTFSTVDFWELLSREAKVSIAFLFNETVPNMARTMVDIEDDGGACTKFILLLYRARLAPDEELARMKLCLQESYPNGYSVIQVNRDLKED